MLNDDRADWREAWALFPGDVAYVWHGALHAATVAESLEISGFTIRSQIIWAKDRLVLSRGDYHWQHEPAWYAVLALPYLMEFPHECAEQVFNMAGVEHKDIDAVQIYDSFSCHVPLALEGYGYCRSGDVGRFMQEDGISLKGKLPVNTGGRFSRNAFLPSA